PRGHLLRDQGRQDYRDADVLAQNLDPLSAPDVLERLLHQLGATQSHSHRLGEGFLFFQPLLQHEIRNEAGPDAIAATAVDDGRSLARELAYGVHEPGECGVADRAVPHRNAAVLEARP